MMILIRNELELALKKESVLVGFKAVDFLLQKFCLLLFDMVINTFDQLSRCLFLHAFRYFFTCIKCKYVEIYQGDYEYRENCLRGDNFFIQ